MAYPLKTEKAAGFSLCGKHRLWLTREWGHGPELVFLMLNPSMADGVHDDATMRRVTGFADREGFRAARVINLFTFITESPDVLFKQPEAMRNCAQSDDVIFSTLAGAGKVVAGWGAEKRAADRAQWVATTAAMMGVPLWCLKQNADGSPGHPLYLNNDVPLVEWAA